MKIGKKWPENRKSGENPISGLFFSIFIPGPISGYLVSYFGPKARTSQVKDLEREKGVQRASFGFRVC